MKKAPNSKSSLDRAISRFAGNDDVRANMLGVSHANAVVAQMIGEGVVKGGTSLRFRYGSLLTRVTKDLDTAWSIGLDEFLKDVRTKLSTGWNGFSGTIDILRQASPKGVPFDYVMQPCKVRLSYCGTPWRVVDLEIGHNEIGDADDCDIVSMPPEIAELVETLALPPLGDIRAMKLEYQIAQKLHGATEKGSRRPHDLIDLQLILAQGEIDFALTAKICRQLFRYRKCQPWPPVVMKNENWEAAYAEQKGALPVLPTVGEAVVWANDLIATIDRTTSASISAPAPPRSTALRISVGSGPRPRRPSANQKRRGGAENEDGDE